MNHGGQYRLPPCRTDRNGNMSLTKSIHDRTQSFFYLYSIYLVCELLAPMIALVAMEVTLELPFYIALGFLTCSLPILICCPETRFDGHGKDIAPIMTADASSEPSEEQVAQQETAVMRFPRTITDHLKTSVLVFRQTGILAAFMVLFLGSLRPATVSILLQYTRVRFDWAVQNTAVLVSAVAIVNIFWFLLVAPQVLSRITATWHTPADLISKRIVLGSLLVLTLGSLVMGLATSSAAIIVGSSAFASVEAHADRDSGDDLRHRLRHSCLDALFDRRVDRSFCTSSRFRLDHSHGERGQIAGRANATEGISYFDRYARALARSAILHICCEC